MNESLNNNTQPQLVQTETKERKVEVKNNNFLVTLLSVLLILACLIAGLFAWQTQKLVKELSDNANQNLATPTSTPSPDPTTGWKMYTNKKYGYSFMYPQSDDSSSKHNKFTDDLVEINGLDSLIIKIEPIETVEKDPEAWWSKQVIDPFINRRTSCYDSYATKSVPSRYTGTIDNAIDPVVNFNTNVVLLRQSDETGCNEPPFNQIILVPTKNGKILSIQEGYSAIGEQILSTFKFIEPEASTEPIACTMDAKICPDGSAVGRIAPNCEFAPCPTPKP